MSTENGHQSQFPMGLRMGLDTAQECIDKSLAFIGTFANENGYIAQLKKRALAGDEIAQIRLNTIHQRVTDLGSAANTAALTLHPYVEAGQNSEEI